MTATATRSAMVIITVNGQPLMVPRDQSIAGALLAAENRVFRRTRPRGRPRTLFCGIGICYDCLVTVDGIAARRACMTLAREGMVVETGGTDG